MRQALRRRGAGRRSPSGWFDLLCLLVVCLGVAALLGPALLGRGALIDLNLLTNSWPWSAASGQQVSLACRSDTIDYYLPGIAAIRDGLAAGQLVTWAPYEVGGAPLASLPNHSAFSPVSLPYYVLPLWLAPAFVKLAEVVVAIGGMVLFLGRLGVRRGPAAVAGLLFCCTGFLVMWTNWPHTKVAAFIPALFWASERLLQRRRTSDVVLLALVVSSMLLGGFPAVTLYALTLAGLYTLVRLRALTRGAARPWREALLALGRALGGVVLGVGLTGFQLVPFAANLGALGLEQRDVAGMHLPGGLFLTTIAPEAYGLCVGERGFAPVSPIEGTVYLGAATLVLAACALLVARRTGRSGDRAPRLFLAVAALVIAVLVWIGGPVLAVAQQLPFFSSNSIVRASSLLGFVVAALAGFGLDRLSRRLDPDDPDGAGGSGGGHHREPEPEPARRLGERWTPRVLAVVGLAVAAAAAYAVSTSAALTSLVETSERAQVLAALRPAGALVGVAVALVAGVLLSRRRWVGAVCLTLVLLLAAGQGLAFARSAWPLSSPDNLFPVTPTHEFLQEELGEERYGGGERTMLPAVSDWYRLRTPTGHEFTAPRWLDLLLAADPGVQLSRTYTTFSRSVSIADMAGSPLLDQLSVKYWTARPDTAPGPRAWLPGAPDPTPYLMTDEPVSCRIPGGALRGVEVVLPRRRAVPDARAVVLRATVRTPGGALVGATQLRGTLPRGPLRVPLAEGLDLTGAGTYDVELRAEGLRGQLPLRGADGGPRCAAVRPAADGAVLVRSDAGATVWERPTALPRIRWASEAEIVTDGDERVRRMTAGLASDAVLVEDADLPGGDGEWAQLRVVEDEPGAIAVQVDAEGEGYLVVGDSILRPGWEATLDGEPVPLVAANHAFAAVVVPAGDHDVRLHYRAPGLRAGALLSAGSAGLAAVLLVVPGILRRRRATHGGGPPRELG